MIVSNEEYTASLELLYKCETREDYIEKGLAFKEWGTTGGESTDEERKEYLGVIWDASHREIRDIADALGLTLRQLALRIGVRYNVIFHWGQKPSTPPRYVYIGFQEMLGLVKIPHED